MIEWQKEEGVTEYLSKYVKFINERPMLLSILYDIALVIPDSFTGKEALIALADSIDGTNFKMYGKGQRK